VRTGESFRFKGQAYECTGSFEYEVPARWVSVIELHSRCPDCGRGFSCTATRSQIRKRELRRRCDYCCSPGVPVPVKLKSPLAREAKAPRAAKRGRTRHKTAPRAFLGNTAQVAPPECRQEPAGTSAAVQPPQIACAAPNSPGGALQPAMLSEREAYEREVDARLMAAGLLG
jgi:hypothetical protein